jgi:hypothetical protein
MKEGIEMKSRMALATVAALAGLALVAPAPASADPRNGFAFDMQCESLGTVTNVSFSSGAASPGLVVDSNQVILPYEWQVDITFTPYVGDPRSASFSYSRGEPRNGRLDYCTYDYERIFPTGVAVLVGSASISYTP